MTSLNARDIAVAEHRPGIDPAVRKPAVTRELYYRYQSSDVFISRGKIPTCLESRVTGSCGARKYSPYARNISSTVSLSSVRSHFCTRDATLTS